MRRSSDAVRFAVGMVVLAAVSVCMWFVGAHVVESAIWFALAGSALAIDRAGRWRFMTGIVTATLLSGVISGLHQIRALPDQVAVRWLFVDLLPTARTLLRPLVVTLGVWTLVAAIGGGGVRSVAARRWRPALMTTGAVFLGFVGFSYLMLVEWPDPALGRTHHSPPLGVSEIFFYEQPQVDLADVVSVPPTPPVPRFDVRKGLSYGPHGYRNTLDLYLPEGTEQPLPVVIYIHGGGTMSGGTDADQSSGLPDVWRDALLARGMAIANINYRLILADPNSPHDEVTGQFPAQVQDCLAAVRFLRAEAPGLGLDPDRIGVMGHSFGGYLASMVGLAWDTDAFLTDTRGGVSSRVQAVVNLAGITDLRTWGAQTRLNLKLWNLPSADYVDSDSYARMYVGGGAEKDPENERLAAASPITHVRQDSPPFLIVYGFRDVAIQGELLHEHLKSAGASSRLVIIPGAGHGLAGVPGTGDLVAEFLRDQLTRGAAEVERSGV